MEPKKFGGLTERNAYRIDIEHELEIEKADKIDQEGVLLMIRRWIGKLKERKNLIANYFEDIFIPIGV